MNHRNALYPFVLIGLISSLGHAEIELSLPDSGQTAEERPLDLHSTPYLASPEMPRDFVQHQQQATRDVSPTAARHCSIDPARDVLRALDALPIDESLDTFSTSTSAADTTFAFRKASLVPALLVLSIMVILRVKLKHHWEQQRAPAL